MLSVLADGVLVADPKERTTAAGRPFATALVRVPCEDGEAMLASVIAFASSSVASLLALSKGDSCAIAGRGKLSSWDKDGETKHGLSVVADRVLSAYQAGKTRKAARAEEQVAA